jgi:hypothetical protein
MSLADSFVAFVQSQSETAEARERKIADTLDLARFCDDYCRLCYAADLRTGLVAGPPTDADPKHACCYCMQPLEPNT